jgi:phage gp37-like protein
MPRSNRTASARQTFATLTRSRSVGTSPAGISTKTNPLCDRQRYGRRRERVKNPLPVAASADHASSARQHSAVQEKAVEGDRGRL